MFLNEFKKRHNLSFEQMGRIFGFSGSQVGLVASGKRPLTESEQRYFQFIAELYDQGEWQLIQRDLMHSEIKQLPKLYKDRFSKKQDLARHFDLDPTILSKIYHKPDQLITPITSYKIILQMLRDRVQFSLADQMDDYIDSPAVSIVPAEPVCFDIQMLRTETDANNETWFCFADVCNQVGHSNHRKAVELLGQKGVTKRYTLTNGGHQEMIFINEGALYKFLVRCQLPRAEAFTDWVTEVVIPSIRKTGSYSTQIESASPGIVDLARLVGVRTEQIERAFEAKLEQLEAKLESRIDNMPTQTLSADEAAQVTLAALASLNAKKAELHNVVISIVNAAKALPNDDPEAQYYSNYGNAWRTVHRHARPAVSSKSDYTSIDQIQHAINGGQLILARLGGCTQLAIDLGAA